MTSIPSLNVTPRTSFGNWLWPSRRRQLFCAPSSSLKRGPVGQAALRSDRAMAHGGEGAFDGIGRSQVFPVLGREVVESEQRVSILAQAVGRLRVFQRVALDEDVECQLGGGLGFGHPDLLQRAFGFRLLALR